MLFSRSLALIYLIAFGSLFSQIKALFFSDGVSPIKNITKISSFTDLPSLFQMNASDNFLYFSCVFALILSSALALNFIKNKYFKALSFFLLYLLYLSFVNTSGVFLSFQWDSLLLEAGLWLIIFILVTGNEKLENLLKWIFFIMIFKLMFMSGLVKLSSMDKTWSEFTALEYHYQTQPLPNPVSSYFHFLPRSFHKLSCLIMFFIELVMPFFIFFGRKTRHIAGLSFIVLQLMIILTGNYGFFNLLTIVLCLPLLDWEELKLNKLNILENSEDIMLANPSIENFLIKNEDAKNKIVYILVLCALVFYASVTLMHIVNRSPLNVNFVNKISKVFLRNFGVYYVNNPYGLFAVMTRKRYEIILQGSDEISEQAIWKSYEFKYKPGNLEKVPPIIAPFQPRLDWQMWFAALSNYKQNPWLMSFVVKLLEGNKEVLNQLTYNPFPDKPPKYIRGLIYDYKFSEFDRDKIWERELEGLYLPPISLK